MEIEEGASVVGVGGGGKIKVGVCVMEKKVKCGSEVLFSLFFFFVTARSMFSSTDQQSRKSLCFFLFEPSWFHYAFFSIGHI